MNLGIVIVIILRIVIPLAILKRPFLGAVISIVLDFVDMKIMTALGVTDLTFYQSLDKMLDLYYLSLEWIVTFSWKERSVRLVSNILYIYRLLGSILFSIFQVEILLLIFPNLFEWFYFYYVFYQSVLKKNMPHSFGRLCLIVIMLLIPKLIHEYLLHVNTVHPWTQNPYIQQTLSILKVG